MTTLTIGWTAPSDDGGCPITGYAVFRDNGAGGNIVTEVNTALDSNIRDKPTLFSMIVTYYPALPTGLTFAYQVYGYNSVGLVKSDTSSFILASIPSTPSSGPTKVSSDSSDTQIRVVFNTLTTTVETGGSTILSYNLQIDDGNQGNFVDLYGITSDTLLNTLTVTGLSKGKNYRIRYRAKNIYGWGDWSPVSTILAATIPLAPPTPLYITSSDASISISMSVSSDDGGSPIIGYELWMNDGTNGGAFT
jgi:titin